MAMKLVAADIGGTHARFAIATIGAGGAITLSAPVTLRTASYPDLPTAWQAFRARLGTPLPSAAAIAIAAPPQGDVIQMTNHDWVIDRRTLAARLGVAQLCMLNDFEAVAHAVARVPSHQLVPIAGPNIPFPATGLITVVGPGTGLGTAQLLRGPGMYHAQPCEGGHVDFGPVDTIDDAILAHLRKRYLRVSTERVVSGAGLIAIYETLASLEGVKAEPCDAPTLCERALSGKDKLASAAVDRFCMTLGSVAGDLALTHGANGVVLAGGIGLRLRDVLPASGFARRFCFKGRYEPLMTTLPIRLLTHPYPGLFGAVAAFAQMQARTAVATPRP